jgi:hypothetical protein
MSHRTDDEIVAQLRALARTSSPVSVASALHRILPEGLTQGSMITYFKRAFPQIPLRILLDAGSWHRLGGGMITDEEFEAMLGPWWALASE